MPGSVIYDFGDMRTFTSSAAEDENRPSQVRVRMDIFHALSEGYSPQLTFLVPVETENLVSGARLITMIMGIRFLTDYLNGDIYYKIHYPDQNSTVAAISFSLPGVFSPNEAEMNAEVAQI
ncbi:MAG: hypothetical protein R3C61_03515 [Bacteroidia bacterium]